MEGANVLEVGGRWEGSGWEQQGDGFRQGGAVRWQRVGDLLSHPTSSLLPARLPPGRDPTPLEPPLPGAAHPQAHLRPDDVVDQELLGDQVLCTVAGVCSGGRGKRQGASRTARPGWGHGLRVGQ